MRFKLIGYLSFFFFSTPKACILQDLVTPLKMKILKISKKSLNIRSLKTKNYKKHQIYQFKFLRTVKIYVLKYFLHLKEFKNYKNYILNYYLYKAVG